MRFIRLAICVFSCSALASAQLVDWTNGFATTVEAKGTAQEVRKLVGLQPRVTNNTGQTVTLRYLRLVVNSRELPCKRIDATTSNAIDLIDYAFTAGATIQVFCEIPPVAVREINKDTIRDLDISVRYRLNTNAEQTATSILRATIRTRLDESWAKH